MFDHQTDSMESFPSTDDHFRAAFEQSIVGLALADHEGRILRANDAFSQIVGRSAADLQGTDLIAHTRPDDDPVWHPGPSSRAPFEKRYVRGDGSAVWASVHVSPVHSSGGEITSFVALLEDVTEQRMTREELVAARRRLDSALIAGEVGTYEWDIGADRLWGDSNFDRIFGVRRDADGTAPLSRFLQSIHPDDRDRVLGKVVETVETMGDYAVEYRIVGEVEKWVIARGRISRDERDGTRRFHGVVLDISERRKLEAELERRTRTYDSILSTTEDFAYLFALDGTFLFANRRLLYVWGKTLPEIIGKNLWELGYPDWHAQMHMRELREVIEQRHTITGEVSYTAPTGIFGVYEYIFSPVIGPDGDVEVIAGTTRDVTSRKEAENAQRTLAEQLRSALDENERLLASERAAREESERAGRMKDEFLATLSHELRTPLSAILGWSQLLATGMLGGEAMDEGITAIQRSARAQAQLVDDLLEMSRIVSGKVQLAVGQVALRDVIAAAIDTIRPAATAREVEIVTDLDGSPLRVLGDANRLQQVFWNLLSNAVKFTPRDGRIAVRLQGRENEVEVTVEDTGEGIAADFLPFVFDRFRQADPSITRRHTGLGLGLAIVKQLVELHGGSVAVASEGRGRGSTFTVVIPCAGAVSHLEAGVRSPRGHDVPLLVPAIDLAGLRILIVDDEPDVRDIMRRMLTQYGADVRAAGSAAEALEALSAAAFDLLISDIGMPREDGYSLMKKVRILHPALPAIALTAYARPEDRERALQAGYAMHVAKPVEPAALVNAVGAVAGAR